MKIELPERFDAHEGDVAHMPVHFCHFLSHLLAARVYESC